MGSRVGRTGAESLAPTGVRFPDRPSRRQSLYRLSYPAHERSNSLRTNAVKYFVGLAQPEPTVPLLCRPHP